MDHALGVAMFAVTLLLIFVGYPVAFTLAGSAMLFSAVGMAAGYFDLDFLSIFPERLFGIMGNSILLAVPYFVLMGTVLQRSGLAEDLLHTIGLLFGKRRGGIALAVVLVGALLAAATG
ncbi:MAG: TRAP transporter large permease subunit, partial [Planctomycetota bacterium]